MPPHPLGDVRSITAAAILVAAGAALVAPSPAGAGFHVWTGGQPRAKGVEAIAADPLNPNRMWAASFGAGVYRSLDAGATWTAHRTGLINTFVRALAVQPRHADSVYCGTNDGVFLSVDGGVNWNKLISTNASVRTIVIHPNRSGVVYAGTFGGGVYKSVNGGKNWSTVNLGLLNTIVRDIALDPAKPETLLAATGTAGGIHRSLNGGLSWTQVADTTASKGAIEQIQFDRLNPNRVYAATLQRGVIKSSDRGVTWVEVNRGLTNFRTRAIAVVDTLRYVGTDGSGVFASSLSDTLWHPVTNGLTSPVVDALFARASAPDACWAGSDGGGIFVTANRGASWSALDGGLLSTYSFSLAVRPTTGALYDGTGFGDQVWMSADGGGTWRRASYLFSHDSEHGLVADPVLPRTVYVSAYGSGVYRSDDDGATWFNPDSLNLTLANKFVRELVAWPGRAGHLFAGGGNGVWESLDGGGHWTVRNGGLPANFSVRALALVPGTPPTLYAGSDSSGVWKSADGGLNWTAATVGIPVPFIHTLLADAAAPLTVFAGTDSGVYRTVNGGISWSPARNGLPFGLNGEVRSLAQDPARPDIMFAGVYGSGVFESLDGGATWAPVFAQAGLGNLRVRALAIDPPRQTVHAGTDDGVWSLSGYVLPAGVEGPTAETRLAFSAWPNPARGRAIQLGFSLPQRGPVALEVFDLRGTRVRTLQRSSQAAPGAHALTWDLRDDRGMEVPSGLYFVRLGTLDGVRTQRVALLGR